tara:strand:- start:89 stop:472 length:384 start_codon:yes stop_codon:yes gene_type:complete
MALDVSPALSLDKQYIQSYSDTGFKVSDKIYNTPILVFPESTEKWILCKENEFAIKSFNRLLDLRNKPEILLLGCGSEAKIVPEEIRDIMRNQGIVVEPMGTGAACRTFNVLVLEERNVAAALLPVK